MRSHVLDDVVSIYGVQAANYVFPLLIVPYLSRVLGPSTWGITAMSQAAGMYGHLLVEYGFVFSATRTIAQASTTEEHSKIISSVTGARLVLAVMICLAGFCSFHLIQAFRTHALLFWAALLSEILKAALPNYYFYGTKQIRFASLLEIAARTAALGGVFFLVKTPGDAWRFFALQGIGAAIAIIVAHSVMASRVGWQTPSLRSAVRTLFDGFPLFVLRGSHTLYTVGNAFILGLFRPADQVGYYAGAEKINGAAVSLLSPLSTALYARSVELTQNNRPKAARLTAISLTASLAFASMLACVMFFGAGPLTSILLGRDYGPGASSLAVLAFRTPAMAVINVLGFQWLLSLGGEKPFQLLTLGAFVINCLLAAALIPQFGSNGMSWAVVVSQGSLALGLYGLLRARKLDPFSTV
jgi:polysaccharide transporter, PST family